MNENFKNKEAASSFFESPEGELFLDNHIKNLYEIETEGFFDIPSWLETYSWDKFPYMYKGKYTSGIFVQYKTGEEFEKQIDEECFKLKKVDDQVLGAELEFQLDDDSLYYHYVGNHFIEIFEVLSREE